MLQKHCSECARCAPRVPRAVLVLCADVWSRCVCVRVFSCAAGKVATLALARRAAPHLATLKSEPPCFEDTHAFSTCIPPLATYCQVESPMVTDHIDSLASHPTSLWDNTLRMNSTHFALSPDSPKLPTTLSAIQLQRAAKSSMTSKTIARYRGVS